LCGVPHAGDERDAQGFEAYSDERVQAIEACASRLSKEHLSIVGGALYWALWHRLYRMVDGVPVAQG
jgi:hypothetical protein